MSGLPPVPPTEFLTRLMCTGTGYDIHLDGRFNVHFDSRTGVVTFQFERASTPEHNDTGYADTTLQFLMLAEPVPEPVYEGLARDLAAATAQRAITAGPRLEIVR